MVAHEIALAEQVGTLVSPNFCYPLPKDFPIEDWFEIEKEFSMIYPSIGKRRANFTMIGCSSWLCLEVPDNREPLSPRELYFVMPCRSGFLEMVRFKLVRTLTLDEHRVLIETAKKMMQFNLGPGLHAFAKLIDERTN